MTTGTVYQVTGPGFAQFARKFEQRLQRAGVPVVALKSGAFPNQAYVCTGDRRWAFQEWNTLRGLIGPAPHRFNTDLKKNYSLGNLGTWLKPDCTIQLLA